MTILSSSSLLLWDFTINYNDLAMYYILTILEHQIVDSFFSGVFFSHRKMIITFFHAHTITNVFNPEHLKKKIASMMFLVSKWVKYYITAKILPETQIRWPDMSLYHRKKKSPSPDIKPSHTYFFVELVYKYNKHYIMEQNKFRNT